VVGRVDGFIAGDHNEAMARRLPAIRAPKDSAHARVMSAARSRVELSVRREFPGSGDAADPSVTALVVLAAVKDPGCPAR
jgi:hypothetical protein